MLYATVLGSERQIKKKLLLKDILQCVFIILIEVVALAWLFGLCENLFLISFIFCLSDKAVEKA